MPKIHEQRAAILTRSDNTSIVTLCRKDPTGGPVLVVAGFHAGFKVEDADALVIAARDDLPICGIEEEGTYEVGVAFEHEDALTGLGVVLVNHSVIAAGQNKFSIVAVFNRS
jgi:hypothetical protein